MIYERWKLSICIFLTFNTCVFSQEIQKYSKTVNETKQSSFVLNQQVVPVPIVHNTLVFCNKTVSPPTDEMDMSFFSA